MGRPQTPQRKSMTATAFTVFAAGWMLLVMQPCLAALDHITAEHASHHDCPHCPAEVAPPCAETSLDCGAPDAAAGADHAKPKAPAVAIVAWAPVALHAPVVAHATHRHERPDPTGPPLTERFCCHLE